MKAYALDTNTVIYFFRGEPQVVERWLSTPRSRLFLPTLVAAELELSVLKSKSPHKRRTLLTEAFETLRLLPFDFQSALHAADIRAELDRRGTPIGPIDTLIAATARANGLTLVTSNTREFARVPELHLEDWRYGSERSR